MNPDLAKQLRHGKQKATEQWMIPLGRMSNNFYVNIRSNRSQFLRRRKRRAPKLSSPRADNGSELGSGTGRRFTPSNSAAGGKARSSSSGRKKRQSLSGALGRKSIVAVIQPEKPWLAMLLRKGVRKQ